MGLSGSVFGLSVWSFMAWADIRVGLLLFLNGLFRVGPFNWAGFRAMTAETPFLCDCRLKKGLLCLANCFARGTTNVVLTVR